MTTAIAWSEEELTVLRRTELTVREIAVLLPHRTFTAIKNRRTKVNAKAPVVPKGTSWSDKDDAKLKQYYFVDRLSLDQVAKKLRRTKRSVKGRLAKLRGDMPSMPPVSPTAEPKPAAVKAEWNLPPDAFKDIKVTSDTRFAYRSTIYGLD
jgi:hypothetical protein